MRVHPFAALFVTALCPLLLAQSTFRSECEAEFLAMGGIPVRLKADGIAPPLCEPVMEGIAAELRLLERTLSAHTDSGAVAAINRGADAGGPCPAALVEVLERSLEVSRATGGAFDVTVGPLVALWKKAGVEGRLPTDAEREAALAKVGYDAVHLEDGRVSFDRSGIRIDLGGVAKGYFGDVAVARLRQAGATRCLVDVGADLVTWRTPEQANFVVGVRNPWGEGLLGVLTVPGGAVVTSGDYERFVTIDGQRYAHIVDPRSGRPVTGMRSVTVLTADGAKADALATALFVMGHDEAAAFVKARDDLEAILVADSADGSPDRQRVFISEGLVELFQWSEDVMPR